MIICATCGEEAEGESRMKLLKYMLFKEAGGIGYDAAINSLAEENPKFYRALCVDLGGIKKDQS